MVTVKWALTYRCNLKCLHCYNSEIRRGLHKELPKERAMEVMKEMKESYVNKVIFYGGEPVLSKNLIPLMRYGRTLGLTMAINTNGIMLTHDIAILLCNMLKTIIISIDGPTASINDYIRGKGSFEKIVYGIKNVLKYKKKSNFILLNMTFHKKFIKYNLNNIIKELKTFLDEVNGVDMVGINFPDFLGRAKNNKFIAGWEDIGYYLKMVEATIKSGINVGFDLPPRVKAYFDIVYDTNFFSKKKFYCMGGTTSLYIEPSGILLPCGDPPVIKYVKQKYEKFLENVDLKRYSFGDAYASILFTVFFKDVLEKRIENAYRRNMYKPCNDCIFFDLHYCNFSCPVYTNLKYPKICQYIAKLENEKKINRSVYNEFLIHR